MHQRTTVWNTLLLVVTVLLVLAAAALVLWAGFAHPYGENSIAYVVSPALALAYAALALVGLRIAQRRRQVSRRR